MHPFLRRDAFVLSRVKLFFCDLSFSAQPLCCGCLPNMCASCWSPLTSETVRYTYKLALRKFGASLKCFEDEARPKGRGERPASPPMTNHGEEETVVAEEREAVAPLSSRAPRMAWVSWGFIIRHSSVMRRRKKEKEPNRGGEEEKKEAFDRAVWRPCVNEPVKGSHCLAATSIWYCTFLFLPHCLLSQCLLSPPLFSLSLSLLKK